MFNSLFFLDNEDAYHIELHEQLCYFEYMLRHSYQSSFTAKMMLYDAAVFLYEKDTPVWNKKMMMQHAVTTFFLEQLVKSKRVQKFNVFTQEQFHHALFISAFYCNHCLDIYEEAIHQLSKDEQVLLREADVINMSILFEKKYQAYESYPKQLIVAQTKVFKAVQQLWQERNSEQMIMLELQKLSDDYRFAKADLNKSLKNTLIF